MINVLVRNLDRSRLNYLAACWPFGVKCIVHGMMYRYNQSDVKFFIHILLSDNQNEAGPARSRNLLEKSPKASSH